MKKSILTTLLLIAISTTTLLGQNRVKFKHKLSQSAINKAGFSLYNGKEKIKIGGTNKLRCIIKLDSKGNILVDFWQILPDKDPFKGNAEYINSETTIDIENLPKLKDNRDKIGDSTKVLCIPFNGATFGVATMPFRLRGSQDISSIEKVNAAVTSPKPDISFTVGWTVGKSVITNRSIINYSATFGGFVGLTGAEIKDGVVKSGSFLYGTGKTTKQVQTNPAMSYGAALTIARNNLGLIFTLGFDNSFGDYSNNWVYQNKPWFGIGLSASLGIF